MNKEVRWVLLIGLGVFLGIFAYDRYTTYQAQKAIQQFTEEMQEVIQRQSATTQSSIQIANARRAELERQRQAQERSKRQAEFDRTTACGINEDAGTCFCLNKNTGARVSVAHDECVKRAREITW